MAERIPNLCFQSIHFSEDVQQDSSHEPMDVSEPDVLQAVTFTQSEAEEIIYSDGNAVVDFVMKTARQKRGSNMGVILPQYKIYFSATVFKDGYDVKVNIGKGAFGTVDICVDRKSSFHFARKRTNLLVDKDSKCFKSLEREVKAMLNLDHFHVIKVYGVIKSEVFVIDVLLEPWGMSLASYLGRKAQQSSEQICFWFYQVLLAVNYMHSKQLVHCDIHLGNILIKNNTIKICDFGSTKTINENLFTESHGHTRSYFPPTVLKKSLWGKQILVSARIDSFAVGKLLLELIRGGQSGFIPENEMVTHIFDKTKWDAFVKDKIPVTTHIKIRHVITGLMSFTTEDGINTTQAISMLDEHIRDFRQTLYTEQEQMMQRRF